jgi:hypothetical protein
LDDWCAVEEFGRDAGVEGLLEMAISSGGAVPGPIGLRARQLMGEIIAVESGREYKQAIFRLFERLVPPPPSGRGQNVNIAV